MPKHRVRDIARLSGLSEATVDRVLHHRGGTRASSAAAVEVAVVELDRQLSAASSGGRELTIVAVVADEPTRTGAIRSALEHVRHGLGPGVVRTVVRTVPGHDPEDAAKVLSRMASRRPHGVLLDLGDDPLIVEQAQRLTKAGVPVVTTQQRYPPGTTLDYGGPDNGAAGATAAYLIHQPLAQADPAPLGYTRPTDASGREKAEALVRYASEHMPGVATVEIAAEGDVSLDTTWCCGVYVIGDSEAARGLVVPLRAVLRSAAIIVVDSSDTASGLLKSNMVDFVLDVDWKQAVQTCCEALLRYHRRGAPKLLSSVPPVVLTPYSV